MLTVLDYETTGTDPRQCRPCSVALASLTNESLYELVDSFYTLVNPGISIPESATQVHGITNARARAEGVRRRDALLNVIERIDKLPFLVIFNAGFDWVLLHAEARRHRLTVPRLPLLDPLVLDRGLDRYRRGARTLSALATHYGVDVGAIQGDLHNALTDAHLTGVVLYAIRERYREYFKGKTLGDLQAEQQRMHREWARNFNDYRRKKGWEPIEEVEWPGV